MASSPPSGPARIHPRSTGTCRRWLGGSTKGLTNCWTWRRWTKALGGCRPLFAESQDSLVRSPAGSALCQRRSAWAGPTGL